MTQQASPLVPTDKAFGAALRALREERELSRVAVVLALHQTWGLNTHPNTYANWELGKQGFGVRELWALLEIVGVTPRVYWEQVIVEAQTELLAAARGGQRGLDGDLDAAAAALAAKRAAPGPGRRRTRRPGAPRGSQDQA